MATSPLGPSRAGYSPETAHTVALASTLEKNIHSFRQEIDRCLIQSYPDVDHFAHLIKELDNSSKHALNQ